MALIETIAKTKTSDDHTGRSIDRHNGVICKAPERLKLLLDKIEENSTVHYISDGYFSLHDLVLSIINANGPAELYISTYAIRELPIRQLILTQQKGLIKSINMVLDYRATVRTPEVFQLAQMNFAKIYQVAIHAKVTVICFEHKSYTILGSSNWTTNPKIEAGIVTTDSSAAAFHLSWMKKLMTDEKIFK